MSINYKNIMLYVIHNKYNIIMLYVIHNKYNIIMVYVIQNKYNIIMLYVKQLQKHNVICHTKQLQYHNGICNTTTTTRLTWASIKLIMSYINNYNNEYHYVICHKITDYAYSCRSMWSQSTIKQLSCLLSRADFLKIKNNLNIYFSVYESPF